MSSLFTCSVETDFDLANGSLVTAPKGMKKGKISSYKLIDYSAK